MPDYRAISEFYDAEYADYDMLGRDVDFFLAHAGEAKLDVLEVGCGTGRAALPVAQAGHRVVGFDIDPGMLAIAEQRREAARVRREQLRYLQADASETDWSGWLGRRRFDVCCFFFNTFLAFSRPEAQESCLAAARTVLKKGGACGWMSSILTSSSSPAASGASMSWSRRSSPSPTAAASCA